MKHIKSLLLAAALLVGSLGATTLVSQTPAAACGSTVDCATSGYSDAGGSSNTTHFSTFIKRIVNLLLYVLGAIAVIVIIVGGIRYTTSNGDAAQMTSAKNTIMYAVVGLVVAVMAFAIVNFVLNSFK